eukprot:1795708-Prymnesium_polylepis.1
MVHFAARPSGVARGCCCPTTTGARVALRCMLYDWSPRPWARVALRCILCDWCLPPRARALHSVAFCAIGPGAGIPVKRATRMFNKGRITYT